MMRNFPRDAKIVFALIIAFFITSFLSHTLFSNFTPQLNYTYIADFAQKVKNVIADALVAQNPTCAVPGEITTGTTCDLQGDVTVGTGQNSGNGYVIKVDNYVFDCHGHTLFGTKSSTDKTSGFLVSANSITVRNCTVTGFYYGLNASTGITKLSVSNSTFSDNAYADQYKNPNGQVMFNGYTDDHGAGIVLNNISQTTITNVTAENDVVGITLSGGSSNTVTGGNYSHNIWGLRLLNTQDNQITQVTASANQPKTQCAVNSEGCETAGILLINSSNNTISGDTFDGNGDGIYLNGCGEGYASSNNTISGNTITNSINNAIEATFANQNNVNQNTLTNASYGIWLGYSQNSTVDHNTISSINHDGINIDHSQCNTITNNSFPNPGTKGNNTRIYQDALNTSCQVTTSLSCQNNLIQNSGALSSDSKTACKNTLETGSLPTMCQSLASTSPATPQTPSSPQTNPPAANQPTGNCPNPTGNEQYNGLLPLGPKIAANIDPSNYKMIRSYYNCENSKYSQVKNSFIPVTVIYDLFFLKGDVSAIVNNLNQMKQYGLYPIIRVASYTSGGNNWIKIGAGDAKIMGQNLGSALGQVTGFPQTPIVYFGNEVNLHNEWGGQSDPADYALSLASFDDGLGNKGQLYFPPLSYGANAQNGISASDFVNGFVQSPNFGQRQLAGAAFTVYGPDYTSITSQYNGTQLATVQGKSFLVAGFKTMITEMGPTQNNALIYDCSQSGQWPQVSAGIISGFLNNQVTSPTTMACFLTTQTYLVVAHWDGSAPSLYPLNGTSGGGNNGGGGGNNGGGPTGGGASISYNPSQPGVNQSFKVAVTASTGYQWVHLNIFDSTGKNLIWKAPTDGTQPKVSHSGSNNIWTYTASGLAAGSYQVNFYADCDKVYPHCTQAPFASPATTANLTIK